MNRFLTGTALAAGLALSAGVAQANIVFGDLIYTDPGIYTGSGSNPGITTGVTGGLPTDGTATNRYRPSNALGADDGDFWSPGLGGVSIFAFGPPTPSIVFDPLVIEVTGSCAGEDSAGGCTGGGHDERADVWTLTGSEFTSVFGAGPSSDGTLNGEDIFDLSAFDGTTGTKLGEILNGDSVAPSGSSQTFLASSPFEYLVIVDDSVGFGDENSRDGFDIAEVKASVVPLPPGVLLLGLGLAGIGGVRKIQARRKAA